MERFNYDDGLNLNVLNLIHKIQNKFGDNAEAINKVGKIIDMIAFKNGVLTLSISKDIVLNKSDEKNYKSRNDDLDIYKHAFNVVYSNGGVEETKEGFCEETDWVDIFGAELNVDVLNRAIDIFEKQFDDKPYLIMNTETLEVFKQLAEPISCSDICTDDINCNSLDGCKGCRYDPDDNNTVVIDYDDENNRFLAWYLYNDNEYTITIDDNLGFGVVKVR